MTNSEAAKCLEYIRFYMEGGECWTDAEFEAMDMAIEALRSATDINVATKEPEIIHCRDCKHYYYADNRVPQEQMCVCDLDGDRWTPDSFCSFGERKSE